MNTNHKRAIVLAGTIAIACATRAVVAQGAGEPKTHPSSVAPPPTSSTAAAPAPHLGPGGPATSSNPRFLNKKFVVDWTGKPAGAGCWTPGAVTAAGSGSYSLNNASKSCLSGLGLTRSDVSIDATGKVNFGGRAASGDVHTLDGAGNVDAHPTAALAVPATAAQVLAAGLLFADDKGFYSPDSLTSSPLPGPAAPAVTPAMPSKSRFQSKQFVADWPAKPASSACWLPASAAVVGPGTYALQNASKACVATLSLTPVAVTIAPNGPVTFAGQPAAGQVHTLDGAGGVDGVEVSALTVPATAQRALASGLLFADDNGVYVPQSVTPVSVIAECPSWSRQQDSNAHIDVDLPRGSVVDAPVRNVILPNQGLTVRVCHERGQAVTVAWGGTRGLTSSTSANVQNEAQAEHLAMAAPSQMPVDVSELRFAPRQAGPADVTISTGTGAAAQTLLTIEIEIDTLYWGSVRIGLGTLFDVGNTWKTYSVSTLAGSRQPEIGQTRSAVAFEIVSGFAPYLFDLGCPGHGRSYTGGCNAFVEPFLGFGLVGTTNTQGVQALTSFHAGFEVEFAKTFSIATTFVMRRAQGLDSGYQVGAPVTTGMTVTDVTRDAWSPGFAIVVNATPSFLQFAMGSGSATSMHAPTTTSTSTTTTVKP